MRTRRNRSAMFVSNNHHDQWWLAAGPIKSAVPHLPTPLPLPFTVFIYAIRVITRFNDVNMNKKNEKKK